MDWSQRIPMSARVAFHIRGNRLCICEIDGENSHQMTRILAPILLLVLMFPSFAFGETMDDLVKRDGLFYKKFTVIPFTGKITGNTQGSLRNGKKHGTWASYFANGQVERKGTYNEGKREGLWVKYWDNGRLSYKGT